jgi:hypothetical protein
LEQESGRGVARLDRGVRQTVAEVDGDRIRGRQLVEA